MIERWEMLPDPHEKFPNRYRVNVTSDEADLDPLRSLFPDKVGKAWMPRVGDYRFSFFFYDPSDVDKETLRKFLSGHPVDSPAPEMDFAAAPSVEVLTPEKVETESGNIPHSESSPLVESAGEALQGWMQGGGPVAKETRPPVVVREVHQPVSSAGDAEPRTEVVSTPEMATPKERLVLSKEPAPEVPAGSLYVRLGYCAPHDNPEMADEIHQVLVQTLQSRKMPFIFHKVFVFSYQWPDRPLADQMVEACKTHQADGLICIGDQRRLEVLFERCNENGIKYYPLSREEAHKRYWRLGLITRIVVKEE